MYRYVIIAKRKIEIVSNALDDVRRFEFFRDFVAIFLEEISRCIRARSIKLIDGCLFFYIERFYVKNGIFF